MSVFTNDELSRHYKLPATLLPSNNDVLRFVLSRTKTGSLNHEAVVRELAKEVQKIWNDADCCPFAWSHIMNIFEKDVWQVYKHLQREKHLPGSNPTTKRSHKKDPSKPSKYASQPRRKSSRIECEGDPQQHTSDPKLEENQNVVEHGKIDTRKSSEISLKSLWEEEGNKLFDVKSEKKVVQYIKKGLCFDSDFYEDQKQERKYRMVVGKVTKEFIEEDKKRKKRKALEERNRLSACGIIKDDTVEEDDEVSAVEGYDDDEDFTEVNICSSFHHFNFSYYTRNKQEQKQTPPKVTKNSEVQTEPCGSPENVPVRTVNKHGKCNLIEARYLEGLSLLMAENLSASEAIKAVHIVDTVIWGQVRHLPLRLDKVYMKAYKTLKKLQSQHRNKPEESLPSSDNEYQCANDLQASIQNEIECVENDSVICLTQNITLDTSNESPEVSRLSKIVSEKLEERKKEPACTLPDVACVRHNHNLLAVYCESKIGEELTAKKGFIMPDGTSRQGVGEVAATVTKIGDKFRALKTVKITKGTANNWANAIIHMLQRLSVASNNDIHKIWGSVSAMISDLCKVNKNLAAEIKTMLGSSWQPGQAFCNLHFTLAIPEAIKTVLAVYQTHIGAEKLFPKTVGFEMNLEDKLIVIQILDCWMRLTSIRWQSRAWNKYKKFTDFAEKRDVKNVGHMLHANRFGEFEERCAGGLYLADMWLDWLSTFSDVRNQLACYLREVEGLMEQCKFLWAGIALIGIHLTVPFMSMILDHHVTPRQLLVVLPKLYNDLKTYPESLCTTDKCGIPSMAPYFLNPHIKETSPYGPQVCASLSSYIKSVDRVTMDLYLKKLTYTIGDVLKRQRGDQYEFGDNKNSDELVTRNLSEELMDDSDTTHTKPIENYFGNFDRELKKTGAQGFDKVNDDLIIKYSRDLIDDGHKWRTKENRKKAEELKLLDNDFNKKQKELVDLGIDEEDAMKLSHENKILKCVSMCKKVHGGPVISSNELENLISSWPGTEKALHTSLNYEIRLRKLSFTQVKADCALFKQKNLSIEEKKRNLLSLICTQLEFKTQADMLDLESAIKESPIETAAEDMEVDEDISRTIAPLASDSTKDTENDIWPPKIGQYIYGLFEDGVFPGEVKSVTGDTVEMDILVPAKVPNMKAEESIWKRPSLSCKSCYKLHRNSVLPFHPVITVNRYSTHRVMVFQLLNYDIAEKFF